MSMQIDFTGILKPTPAEDNDLHGTKYKSYKLVHSGVEEKIEVNVHAEAGSPQEAQLAEASKIAQSFKQEYLATKEAGGTPQLKTVRLAVTGFSATANVTVQEEEAAVPSKDKRELVRGVVHRVNALDVVLVSSRVAPPKEGERFTVTAIGSLEADYDGKKLEKIDCLQMPLQVGQSDAYHIRVLPTNPAAEAVLLGVPTKGGKRAPVEPGVYAIAGTLIREAKEGAEPEFEQDGYTLKKPAFHAWDRLAVRVSTAFPVEIQNMRDQRNVNAKVAQQTQSVSAMMNAFEEEGEESSTATSFGADLTDDLLS